MLVHDTTIPCAECGLPALVVRASVHRMEGGGPLCASCRATPAPAKTLPLCDETTLSEG